MVSLYCGGGAAACAGAINGAQESYQTWLRGGTYNDQFDAGFEAGVTGFIAAGINSNISGYYGNTWTASRVLVTSVAGGAISEMKGGSFASGFKTSFVLSSLTYGNYLMRENQVANASLNPDGSNIDGESAGFFGDGKKLAGARRTVGENGAYLRCDSLMGGCQGAPRLEDDVRSSFFGLPYPPGSIPDRINEAFAGPHDILRNLTGSYDALGNAVRFTGAMGVIDNVRNYALVIPAAPFAFAALVPTSSYDTIRSARDR